MAERAAAYDHKKLTRYALSFQTRPASTVRHNIAKHKGAPLILEHWPSGPNRATEWYSIEIKSMAEHNKTRQISPSKRRGTGGVTLADVATLAGVSTITASRALSNPTLVNPATRARVHEAVHKSGYIPNYLAGGLKSKRSRLIACLVPTIASGSAFLVAVHAMSEAFGGAGYQVLLGERGYDVSREETLVESVIARRPDGIVLTGVMQSEAARRRLSTTGIPVVETWDMTDSPIDLLVGFSHEDVGRAIAHYLYRRGRRRLGVISSTEPRGAARARGFAEAVVALGLAPSVTDVPTHTIGAPTQLIHGRAGVASLLAAHPTLDAISCATDLVALGALIEARVRGICVPDDLAIVGFGDLDFAVDVDPPLTTVRIDGSDIGRRVAALLMARIDGRRISRRITDVGFQLIERTSA